MKLTFLLIIISFCQAAFCQKEEHRPELLVPYNDHGNWGWCDTLGNVVVAPEFDKVGFFTKRDKKAIRPFRAFTKSGERKNYYELNSGLVIPDEFLLVRDIDIYYSRDSMNLDFFVVKSEKGKYGIYDSRTKKLALKCVQDSIYVDANHPRYVYFKKTGDKKFQLFDAENQKVSSTDIVVIDSWHVYEYAYVFETVLYKHADGTWTKLMKSGHELVDFDDGKWTYGEEVDLALDFTPDEYISEGRNNPPPKRENPPDGTLDMASYRDYPKLSEKYGFKTLKIVRKSGHVGMITENDSIVVPFEYDHIQFLGDVPTKAKLFKDGKEGVKLIFTRYPLIEAKYDKISNIDYPKRLPVNARWSFLLFKVDFGEEWGYVGENGVEYFKLR